MGTDGGWDQVNALLHQDSSFEVAVFEMSTGNVIYKGQVTVTGDSSKSEEHMRDLHLTNIYLH